MAGLDARPTGYLVLLIVSIHRRRGWPFIKHSVYLECFALSFYMSLLLFLLGGKVFHVTYVTPFSGDCFFSKVCTILGKKRQKSGYPFRNLSHF